MAELQNVNVDTKTFLGVVGLASLQSKFDVLQGWGGDPCLPEPYSWEWINCTSDATPRVTALYLGSFGLSGSLPDFSSMTALETIDMHNNSISGSIYFLGTLPNFKELDLADNQLTGSIPTSLSNNNKVKLDVTGNPNLCTTGQCSTWFGTTTAYGRNKKKNTLPAILTLLFWAIVGALAILQAKNKTTVVTTMGPGQNVGANNRPNGTAQCNAVEMVDKLGGGDSDE